MKVKEKLMLDHKGLKEHGAVTIVALGDSVTHGVLCNSIDQDNNYPSILKRKLNAFRDYMPVNVINSGIEGTTARDALDNLYNRVLKYQPDLVIVCFGLNDVNGELTDYLDALKGIFNKLLESKTDVIFMTPNTMNTYVADGTPKEFLGFAQKTAQMQTSGRMDEFMENAKKLAYGMGICVCDVYSEWKELAKTEDTTLLLANRINHPVPKMHELFADKLYSIIMK